jgi:uncharacterized protein DUF4326
MSTKVVHCKRDPYDVYIGRPGKWGNPFFIRLSALHDMAEYLPDSEHMEGSRAWSLAQYRKWIQNQPELMNSLHELRGKILGCWCSPKPCHGDILKELADG